MDKVYTLLSVVSHNMAKGCGWASLMCDGCEDSDESE
jgi:hypothetical protein